MPAIDLAAIVRAQGMRRRGIAIRPISTTKAQVDDLAIIIAPVVRAWQEAQADILRGYTLPTQDGMTTDNAQDMQGAIDRTADEISRLVLLITPRLRSWAIRIEKYHRTKWIGAVFTATNIDLANVLTSNAVDETIEAFVGRNVALVKDISAQAQGKIADTVFRNYQQRQPIVKVAKEISEATGFARARAKRVAAHQTQQLSAVLDRQRQQEAGIDQFTWRWSGKQNGRPEHMARDGKIYSWDDNDLPEYPGDLPNCGCKSAAYLDIMGEIE